MSEGHEEPPADVRSFLPRPGEPVEDYAERLRALHRDLTLVLEAVERGLAVSVAPPSEPAREPVPVGEPESVLLDPDAASGGPRVEIMPAPSGATTRGTAEDRRAPPSLPADPDAPDPPSFGPAPFPPRPSVRDLDEPAGPAEPAWVERPDPIVPGRPRTAVAATAASPAAPPVRVEAAPPPSSPADRPWVLSSAVPGGPPAWVDATARRRRGLPPLVVAALLTGWLAAVALLLALLLD